MPDTKPSDVLIAYAKAHSTGYGVDSVLARSYLNLLTERDELMTALKLALTTPGMIKGRVEAEALIARAEGGA